MDRHDRILVTGAHGLVGSSLIPYLQQEGFENVVGVSSADCDLMDRDATRALFAKMRPAYVFHMAGYVHGIMGNMRNQAEAYLRNALINTHVIEAAHQAGVKKILAMGTVAMYPDPLPSSPAREDDVLNGLPHASEYAYAYAKRGMLVQLQAYHESYGMKYAVALSTNLYGPHDRFDTETGHVIPSLIKKFYDAQQTGDAVTVWGDGSAYRDFLHVSDAVKGLHIIMEKIDGVANLATGTQNPVRDVVTILAAHTGLQERVKWDAGKPSGQLHRSYDIRKLAREGFACKMTLEAGLRETYDWYAGNAGAGSRSRQSA